MTKGDREMRHLDAKGREGSSPFDHEIGGQKRAVTPAFYDPISQPSRQVNKSSSLQSSHHSPISHPMTSSRHLSQLSPLNDPLPSPGHYDSYIMNNRKAPFVRLPSYGGKDEEGFLCQDPSSPLSSSSSSSLSLSPPSSSTNAPLEEGTGNQGKEELFKPLYFPELTIRQVSRQEIKILILTNDDYLFSFGRIWWTCFRHYWPTCPWEALFITPSLQDPFLPIRNFPGGWNRRLFAYLQSLTVEPEAVLLLHEDMLIGPEGEEGRYAALLSNCLGILEKDPQVCSIGLVRKDPEREPYPLWPEMLGIHDLSPGVLPIDLSGIPLFRTSYLKRHLQRVIAQTPNEKDLGRNGVAEFSFLGSNWAREENQLHLRVLRHREGPQGILNLLTGVTITMGKLSITDPKHLYLVEQALGQPLLSLQALDPLLSEKGLPL